MKIAAEAALRLPGTVTPQQTVTSRVLLVFDLSSEYIMCLKMNGQQVN